jgi:hypothetical protein
MAKAPINASVKGTKVDWSANLKVCGSDCYGMFILIVGALSRTVGSLSGLS